MSPRIARAVRGAMLALLVLTTWRICSAPKQAHDDIAGGSARTASATSSAPPTVAPTSPREPIAAVTPRPPRSATVLHSAADAGDVGAQIDFGALLAKCVQQGTPAYADTIARQFETLLASDVFDAFDPATRKQKLDEQREQRDILLREHADCVLLAEAGVEPSHVWLERAARSGDIEARVAYAAMSLDEFTRAGSGGQAVDDHYLVHLDEVVRRRDLSRRWLDDAVHAGSIDALRLRQRAYAGQHPLYPADARQAAIHAHALALATARQSGDPAALRNAWDAGPQLQPRDGFGPDDRVAIDRGARRIYLQWFGPAPDGG